VTRKHLIRIALLTLGCVVYLPAMILMIIRVAGPIELQALFDWLAGRCASDCNGWNVLETAIQIVPIIVTGPVLVWIGIIWVRRGRRSDRDAKAIADHFATAPDRISPQRSTMTRIAICTEIVRDGFARFMLHPLHRRSSTRGDRWAVRSGLPVMPGSSRHDD